MSVLERPKSVTALRNQEPTKSYQYPSNGEAGLTTLSRLTVPNLNVRHSEPEVAILFVSPKQTE